MTSLSENTVVTTSGGLVELGYKDSLFPTRFITATSAASAQTLMGAISVVCDGSPIELEVFLAGARPDAGAGNRQLYITLLIDGTRVLDQFGLVITPAAGDVYRPTTIKRRLVPTPGVHTYEVRAYVDAGTGFIEDGTTTSRPSSYIKASKIIQASQFIVPLASAPLVTSLPSAPIDGQEIRYVANATNGIIWNFRYRAASTSAYKWEFIGGPPLYAEVGMGQADQNTSSSSYVALSTPGPSITLPLAGDYDVEIGMRTSGAIYMSYDIGSTGATNDDGIFSSANNVHVYKRRRKNNLSAITLTSKYSSPFGGAVGCRDRSMTVYPIRVG